MKKNKITIRSEANVDIKRMGCVVGIGMSEITITRSGFMTMKIPIMSYDLEDIEYINALVRDSIEDMKPLNK